MRYIVLFVISLVVFYGTFYLCISQQLKVFKKGRLFSWGICDLKLIRNAYSQLMNGSLTRASTARAAAVVSINSSESESASSDTSVKISVIL